MSSYLQDLETRFLRYVQIDTQSDETSKAVPSTGIQLDLLRQLVIELEELGTTDVTLTDYGSDGLDFGSLNPLGTEPEAAQNGTGAIKLEIGNDTNVNINIQIKGDDFSDGLGHTIAIGNAKYDSDNSLAGASSLTTSYVTWYSVSAYTADSTECYHWLSIPSGQTAGNYSSTFYYQAVQQ